MNARDISRSFDDITNTVASLPFKLTVLAIRETWTTVSTENLFTINGYNSLFKSRDTSTPVSYTHLRAHETDSYLVCPRDGLLSRMPSSA